jgi:hypothetical protein
MLIRPDAYRLHRVHRFELGTGEDRCENLRRVSYTLRERSKKLIDDSHLIREISDYWTTLSNRHTPFEH